MRESECTIGIDLGGTTTRVGLYDGNVQLRGTRTMVTRVADGPHGAVRAMVECIRSIQFEVGGVSRLPIGIGSPGPINLREGVLGLLPNLPGWNDFPLRTALAEAAGASVILESDANAAAIAEWKLGAGMSTGVDTMAMITLGTGVGGGIILKSKVWHGMFGMGGEVGHATVAPDGALCGCGSRGCLEMYASASGVVRLYQASRMDLPPGDLASLTAKDIAERAQSGEQAALNAYQLLGRSLGIGLANLVNTLDPPLLVIGGGVAEAWSLFEGAMFQALREYSVVYRLLEPERKDRYEQDKTFVTRAELGPAAGLIGAALLPRLELSWSAAHTNSDRKTGHVTGTE